MKVRELNGRIRIQFGPEDFEETRSVSSKSVWFELHLSPSQLERMLTAMQKSVRSVRVTKEGK